MTKIYKVILSFDDASAVLVGDAIEEDGSLWLVPEWLGQHRSGPRVPERMIRLNPAHVQPAPLKYQVDYILSAPLPAILRDARSTAEVPPGFEVRFAIRQILKDQTAH